MQRLFTWTFKSASKNMTRANHFVFKANNKEIKALCNFKGSFWEKRNKNKVGAKVELRLLCLKFAKKAFLFGLK